MNKEILYNGDVCKLCGFGHRDHADDCPGRMIDGATFEVTYEGPRCLRSCCGYIEGSAAGATLEECVTDAAESLTEAARHRCEARLVYVLDVPIDDLVTAKLAALHDAKVAKRKAAELAAEQTRRENERTRALAALEAERGDLTPEAYERRRAALA